jgi:rfaE bifunctional protein nucleotidyltransferase chain/domain/rfaE bifunctional protein kinase chain/domain
VIGDALLDRDIAGTVERQCPDGHAPVLDERTASVRPGGAALAATLAAAEGRNTVLLSAIGQDGAGAELRRLLDAHGVALIDLGLAGSTPEKIRLMDGRRTLLRLDRGAERGTVGELTATARAAIGWADVLLVSDYGRGLTAHPALRAVLARRCTERAPLVWDPHPLGADPLRGVTLVTPNAGELQARPGAPRGGSPKARAVALAKRWGVRGVCVTLGADGALLVCDERTVSMPAPVVSDGDPCGAGDCFAAAAACALGDGADLTGAVSEALAVAGAFVERGGAFAACSSPPPPAQPSMQRSTRPDALTANRMGPGAAVAPRRRETLVATGGCFDLLHAGHLTTLQAARALGDRLIVCINSDTSVRRLKGPGRPIVAAADRAAMLEALRFVDAVAIFDEDEPSALIERLRPDIWAKGGDYAGCTLPESAVLSQWGGRAVVLPYLDGHSTTRLIQEATYLAAG